MPILYINTGTSANSGDGDSLRTAFHKLNQNLTFLVNQYVEAGVASVQGKQGIVVLDLQDIETALGYIPQDRDLFDGQVTERLRGYLSTSSLASYGFLTSSTFETIVSQRAYTTPQAVRDIVSTSTLTLANLDATAFISLNMIIQRDELNATKNELIDRISQSIVVDLSTFVTQDELVLGLGSGAFSPSTLKSQNTSTYSMRLREQPVTLMDRFYPRMQILENINTTTFGISSSYSIYRSDTRLKYLIDSSGTSIVSYSDLSQGTSTIIKSMSAEFSTDGLRFQPEVLTQGRLQRQNTAQSTSFTINATRPYSPADRSGIPGQIYIPNAYEIETDPFIYICIDNTPLTDLQTENAKHRNWIRIPIRSQDSIYEPFEDTLDPTKSVSKQGRWEGSYFNSGFGLPYVHLNYRPSAYLYPNPEHDNNQVTFRVGNTYTATIYTMLYMHLADTGNSYSGNNFPPPNFTYSLCDASGNSISIPGMSLQVLTHQQQQSTFGDFIRLAPTKRLEMYDTMQGYTIIQNSSTIVPSIVGFNGIKTPNNPTGTTGQDVPRATPFYTGTTIHLVGTPTQAFKWNSDNILENFEFFGLSSATNVYLKVTDPTHKTEQPPFYETQELAFPLNTMVINSEQTSKNDVVRQSGRGFEFRITTSTIVSPVGQAGFFAKAIEVKGGEGIIDLAWNTGLWTSYGLTTTWRFSTKSSYIDVLVSNSATVTSTNLVVTITDRFTSTQATINLRIE